MVCKTIMAVVIISSSSYAKQLLPVIEPTEKIIFVATKYRVRIGRRGVRYD